MSLNPKHTGIHKRKFGNMTFESYGLGAFRPTKKKAEKLAEAERRLGYLARVVPCEGGYRVFYESEKDHEKRMKKERKNKR